MWDAALTILAEKLYNRDVYCELIDHTESHLQEDVRTGKSN